MPTPMRLWMRSAGCQRSVCLTHHSTDQGTQPNRLSGCLMDVVDRQARLPAVLTQYLQRCLSWVGANGWAGWDPYDLWDTAVGQWALAGRSLHRRAATSVISRLEEVFPIAIRRALSWRFQQALFWLFVITGWRINAVRLFCRITIFCQFRQY